MKKIFITGIGTDVGKTFVSAVFTEAFKADYWKPIQCGLPRDAEEVKNLISNTETEIHPERFLFRQALSPHAAAKTEKVKINLSDFKLPSTSNTLVIEGAGGLMVPLNNKELVIDLIHKFDTEVILVVKNYLGNINHTLLSIEALKSRKIKIAGLVFNGKMLPLTEEVILKQSGLKCLLHIKEEKEITKTVVLKYAKQLISE